MNEFQAAMIRVAIEDAMKSPCRLCGGQPAGAGVWFPTAECSRRLGAPEGKIRVMAYSLCQRCMQQKDAGTRVENFFLEQADLSQPEAEKKTPIVTSQ